MDKSKTKIGYNGVKLEIDTEILNNYLEMTGETAEMPTFLHEVDTILSISKMSISKKSSLKDIKAASLIVESNLKEDYELIHG